MNQSIVLSAHVINTIKSLPKEEKLAIVSAIAGELILGANIDDELTPSQSMLYAIIRDYVRRDSVRFHNAC